METGTAIAYSCTLASFLYIGTFLRNEAKEMKGEGDFQKVMGFTLNALSVVLFYSSIKMACSIAIDAATGNPEKN